MSVASRRNVDFVGPLSSRLARSNPSRAGWYDAYVDSDGGAMGKKKLRVLDRQPIARACRYRRLFLLGMRET